MVVEGDIKNGGIGVHGVFGCNSKRRYIRSDTLNVILDLSPSGLCNFGI